MSYDGLKFKHCFLFFQIDNAIVTPKQSVVQGILSLISGSSRFKYVKI